MSLKIKTVSTNLEIATISGDKNGNFPTDYSFIVGQFYKAQIAYVKDKEVGYYSTVGVFKYTEEPTLSVNSNNVEFEIDKKNYCGPLVIGKYEAPENDINEKVYSYCFNIYSDDSLLTSSGELLHNSSEDTDPKVSRDSYQFT